MSRSSPRRAGRWQWTARLSLFVVVALLGSACGAQRASVGPEISISPTTAPTADTTPTSPACADAAARPADTAQWWQDRVFYEAFVRSFSDANGDGIGDLAGLTAKLDYLNDGDPATTSDLGVSGIWLMPIFESPSYHGYDTLDYDAIASDYGDLGAFDAFVAAAHARGIKVLLDLVVNHTSVDHPWFKDALAGGPHRDWYNWSETDPGWPSVAGGSPWHPSSAGWYYGAFWSGMPDLNLRNPDVTTEIQRIAGEWLDRGVDGFRLDAAKHLIETGPTSQVNTPETRAWLSAFRDRVHASHPEALVLGEVWEPRIITSGYVEGGSLDMAFDFGIGPAALGAARLGDATTLTVGMQDLSERYPAGSAATFLTNHDQRRVMTELRGDERAASLAAAALLTGPGVPFVYYGEELGIAGSKPDENLRTPFPWDQTEPRHGFTSGSPWEPFWNGPPTTNVGSESADPASLLSIYRNLIHLRAANPVLWSGSATRIEVARSDVAVTLRWQADRGALVIQNLGDEPASGQGLSLATGPLCGAPRATVAFVSAPGYSAEPTDPIVTVTGGLDGYTPLAEIPARSTVVVNLSP
ncbi:MAG: alpha-amylase family glycosyl hydrolase [Chloroflexota bacterium]